MANGHPGLPNIPVYSRGKKSRPRCSAEKAKASIETSVVGPGVEVGESRFLEGVGIHYKLLSVTGSRQGRCPKPSACRLCSPVQKGDR